MMRPLKIMLLWVLMIAFPMQGIAAAVMAGCGPNHHKVMTTDVSHAHESAPNSHVHEAADNTHSHALQAQHEAQTFHPIDSTFSKSKCSNCAACCLVTAIAPTIHTVVSPLTAGIETNTLPEKQFAVNFPDGLERPPHTHLL